MTVFEPMDVAIHYTKTPRGSRPEPLFDSNWSRIDQLRWRAGYIKAKTGVTVEFNDKSQCFRGDELVSAYPEALGVTVTGPYVAFSFTELDAEIETFLNGLEMGAELFCQRIPVT